MKSRRAYLVAIIAFACAAGIMVLSNAGSAQPSQVDKIVSTEWLAANLTRDKMRIIDVRNDVKDYWGGHIPGAVYFSPEAMRLSERGVPVMLMPPEALAIMLGKRGLTGRP